MLLFILKIAGIILFIALVEIAVIACFQPNGRYNVDREGNLIDAIMGSQFEKIIKIICKCNSKEQLANAYNMIETFEIRFKGIEGSNNLLQELRAEYYAQLCMWVGI